MKKVLIVTFTSGGGDPFSADCIDTVIEELEAQHGGKEGHIIKNGHGAYEIEWLDSDGEVEFHAWAEPGEHIAKGERR